MIKMLNKLIYFLKNIMLPILLSITIYIVVYMFKRLEKEIFGSSLMEFLSVIAPFIILLILIIINSFLGHKNVYNNLFYNITSFIIMIVIGIFCYRALFDQNMYLWHKYGYNINFNYFADQIAPMKVMLYGLIIADILLVIEGYLKKEPLKDSIGEKEIYIMDNEEVDKEEIYEENKESKNKSKNKKVNKK